MNLTEYRKFQKIIRKPFLSTAKELEILSKFFPDSKFEIGKRYHISIEDLEFLTKPIKYSVKCSVVVQDIDKKEDSFVIKLPAI
jgi:hypothetical protein